MTGRYPTQPGVLGLALTLACASTACGGDKQHGGNNAGSTSQGGASSASSDGSGSSGSGGASSSSGTTGSGGGAHDGVTYVKASNPGVDDLFGVSLALSSDGSVLAVGANREASAAAGIGGPEDDDSLPDAGAVYLFAQSDGSWQQAAYIKASNPGEGDAFGASVALAADGATLAVGAPFEASAATASDGDQNDDSAPEAGAVYLFVKGADSWEQQAYLKAANAGEDDHFGLALSLSADGNTLAVGAEGESSSSQGDATDPNDDTASGAGAVYVFARAGTVWEQRAYLKASNAEAGDQFGGSVALSADGATLAVGAYYEDSSAQGVDGDPTSNAAARTGAVYIFENDGIAWQQQAYLKRFRSGGSGNDSFGSAVSLSSDASVLVVGAPGDASSAVGIDSDQTDSTMPFAGAAYVFARSDDGWQPEAYLKASNTGEGDEFGHHLHLSGNGQTLAIGAALEGSMATGINGNQGDNSAGASGAVYLFQRDAASWRQAAFVKAPNTGPGDRFGFSLSLSQAGSLLATGASRESSAAPGINADQNDNSASRSGAVYLYDVVSALANP